MVREMDKITLNEMLNRVNSAVRTHSYLTRWQVKAYQDHLREIAGLLEMEIAAPNHDINLFVLEREENEQDKTLVEIIMGKIRAFCSLSPPVFRVQRVSRGQGDLHCASCKRNGNEPRCPFAEGASQATDMGRRY